MPIYTPALVVAAPRVISVHTTGSSVPLILVVAVLTPLVTGAFLAWNTGRRLAAEDRRLKETLSFERAERDRSALITVIESLARDLQDLSIVAIDGIDFARAVNASSRMREGLDREPADDLVTRTEKLNRSAMNSLIRLSLMLGDRSEPFVAQVLAATNASRDGTRALLDSDPDGIVREAGESFEQVEAARQEFFKRAREYTAVLLHDAVPTSDASEVACRSLQAPKASAKSADRE